VSRKRLEQLLIGAIAIAFGGWGVDLLPGPVVVALTVMGVVMLPAEFARWLDRKAY
jgi:hypothetical protein